jgi:hypothetical protein
MPVGLFSSLFALMNLAWVGESAIAAPHIDSITTWLLSIPEAQTDAFLKWSPASYLPAPVKDPFTLPRTTIQCDSKNLMPTSPYQDTKNYEAHFTGRFNHHKLAPTDRFCLVSSKTLKPACFAPDTLHAVVMSDFFTDSCGSVYKGYWSVVYSKREDNMGTLLSKGRTLFPSPRATTDFPEMIEGPVYSVDSEEFLFFTESTAEPTSASFQP